MVGGPRWVSQWATLAASHIRTDPEGSGGDSHVMVTEDRGTWFSLFSLFLEASTTHISALVKNDTTSWQFIKAQREVLTQNSHYL